VVLVYHALAAQGGDSVDQLVRPHDAAVFEAQLRYLGSRYRLVAAEHIQSAVAARGRGERFPVALTFDDDLVSHVRLARPILQRAGATATFFLCGSSLDRPHAFWWQRLQRAVDAELELPVEGRDIHEVAERIESMSPEKRDQVGEWLARGLGPDPHDSGLRSEHVRELVECGFDVGFHTLRHDRLTALDDAALAQAMAAGRAELEHAAARPLTTIAYPHGKADERVGHAAREAGFRLGFTGRSEPIVPDSDPMLLGRFEPAHDSVAALALQLVLMLLRRPHR
jgi:peptidoglycan/xylan/chitin deacetylase (PgdA/CDA1 family)